jgi:hypothetical protein
MKVTEDGEMALVTYQQTDSLPVSALRADTSPPSATSDAHRRWHSALMTTAWGRANIRRVLLVEDGEPLASATRCTCLALFDRRPTRVVVVGDVSAPGASAADDVARHALVEQMMAEARTGGTDIALLFSPLDPEWCEDQQFVDITPDTITLAVEPGRRPGAPMTMIRAGEDQDLPAIAAMGPIHAARFRFHLDRDVDFIQHGIISRRLLAGLAVRGARELQFYVTEEGSTAAAYVVLTVTGDEWWIEACGDREPSGYRVGCILPALLARDVSAPPVIRGWLPDSLVPPQATVVSRQRSPTAIRAAIIGSNVGTRQLSPTDTLFWSCDVF